MKEITKIETITPYEAGKILGVNAETIRARIKNK